LVALLAEQNRVDELRAPPQMSERRLLAANGCSTGPCRRRAKTPTGAHERHIGDLAAAAAQVRDTVLAS
jgi:hypothetical protein